MDIVQCWGNMIHVNICTNADSCKPILTSFSKTEKNGTNTNFEFDKLILIYCIDIEPMFLSITRKILNPITIIGLLLQNFVIQSFTVGFDAIDNFVRLIFFTIGPFSLPLFEFVSFFYHHSMKKIGSVLIRLIKVGVDGED
jgi:hypothetical protein